MASTAIVPFSHQRAADQSAPLRLFQFGGGITVQIKQVRARSCAAPKPSRVQQLSALQAHMPGTKAERAAHT